MPEARYLADDSHYSTPALQVWLILIGAAQNRQDITYEGLAEKMGIPGALPTLRNFLNLVMYFCEEAQLPPLTVLTVGQATGQPGRGYTAGSGNLSSDRAAVFGFDWYSIFPPTVEELEELRQRRLHT